MHIIDNDKTPSDPELDALLKLLRETPARDQRAVASGSAKYITDVGEIFGTDKSSAFSWLERFLTLGWLGKKREPAGMRQTMKLSYSVLLAALLLVVLLFSSAGATAFAAKSALPGDALYQVKMSIEQAQVRLVADAARLAELHLEFAERRLDEISGLIAEGRYGEIERATQEFEYHVQQALVAMQTVAAGDPLRAQALAVRVTAALSEYARSLSGMMMNVPESTRASMERAIITSQNAGNVSPAEFSENVNVNENINDGPGNSDGDVLENDQSNQNGGLINEIGNENHNGEDNTNLNSNENEATNDNQANQSGGDDQNSNSNLNDQKNDNQNDAGGGHDNDDSGSKDNDNDRDTDNNNNDHGGNDNGGDD